MGKPALGGPFTLVDHNGHIVTNHSFKDRYRKISMPYFLSLSRSSAFESNSINYTIATTSFELIKFWQRYMLVYFGFTFCPDICPAELAKVTKAIEILGKKSIKQSKEFLA